MPWWQAKMSGYVGMVVKWHDIWRNTRTRRSKWLMIAQRKWMRPWGKWVHQWSILSLHSALECCANHRAFSFTWRLGSPTFDAASLRGRERLWRLKSSGRRSTTICTFCVPEHPHELAHELEQDFDVLVKIKHRIFSAAYLSFSKVSIRFQKLRVLKNTRLPFAHGKATGRCNSV